MTRVAIIGSRGQLGSDLVVALQKAGSFQVVPLTHTEIEVSDPAAVRAALTRVRPEVVVNCASYVRVDECEERPEQAFRVNSIGALQVARACDEVGAKCVYVSTDYVFDGAKGAPYTEDDVPCPINVYGTSKLAGEYLVRQACSDWLLMRVASLFGRAGVSGKGGNFIETILANARAGEPLRVVNDIRMSPTYTVDAAQVLVQLLKHDATGVFHVTNAGVCSWYEFARTVLDLSGLRATLEPIRASAYPARARRPVDSALTSVRMSAMSLLRPRPWPDAVHAYLRERGHIP